MRTSLFASAVLGLSTLASCVGVVDAPGTTQTGGDDDTGGDDTGGGTPALQVAIDKQTMTTELRTANMATITLTSSGGFTGSVTVTPSVLDATGAPMTAWTATVDTGTVTVPANGSIQVHATLNIPSDATVFAGKLHLDVSGGPTAITTDSTVTANQIVTFVVKNDGNGKCLYPDDARTVAKAVQVKVGTKVHFLNNFGSAIIIHSNGQASGIDHEGQGGAANIPNTADNDFYERTATTAGGAFSWYCHNNNDDNANDPFLQVIN